MSITVKTVLDSWGKMKPGLMFGEYTDFGKWDQCIAVRHKEDDTMIKGKFCVFELHWQLPANKTVKASLEKNFTGSWIQKLIMDADSFLFQQISNSICVPSTCTANELEAAIQICMYPIHSVFFRCSFSIHVHSDGYQGGLSYSEAVILSALILLTYEETYSHLFFFSCCPCLCLTSQISKTDRFPCRSSCKLVTRLMTSMSRATVILLGKDILDTR